ncbi:hypothetical protein [Luteolibacter sp. LG18]|uniref:hypothetical protein n=1 Tax=Luteolibacter sp. LG18 TaxID=2819286 RepID=UPI0030C7113E
MSPILAFDSGDAHRWFWVILGGVVFSMIGLGAFGYGKKLELWKPKIIGLLLMGYPYFVYNVYAVWAIGIGLCTLLWFHHDE